MLTLTHPATTAWAEISELTDGFYVATLYADYDDFKAKRPAMRGKSSDKTKLHRWIEKQFRELESVMPAMQALGEALGSTYKPGAAR